MHDLEKVLEERGHSAPLGEYPVDRECLGTSWTWPPSPAYERPDFLEYSERNPCSSCREEPQQAAHGVAQAATAPADSHAEKGNLVAF
jgi:hypothetical protein